jgi:putative alpha-1,2-mannosidase
MVALSPDTGHKLGYHWAHDRILGFSHTHLSGIGCRAMGDISLMPTTGGPRDPVGELRLVAGGGTLAVEAPGAADPRARYVQSLHVGGIDSSRIWLSHDGLLHAGTLAYDLGTRAGAPWGTRPGDAPPPACPR